MSAKPEVCHYEYMTVTDPADPESQRIAGGDVPRVAADLAREFRQVIADMPVGSVSLAVRHVYLPSADSKHSPKCRLRTYVSIAVRELGVKPVIRELLERGSLSRLHRLVPVDDAPIPWASFEAACDLRRPWTALRSVVGPEANSKGLPVYPILNPLRPKKAIDFGMLDAMASALDEPFLVETCVEPCDVEPHREHHSRYIARVRDANRRFGAEDGHLGSWGPDQRDWAPIETHRPDPVADEASRRLQRLHDTLDGPNLRYHVRILARSEAVAAFLGASIAASALFPGCYETYHSKRGDSFFDRIGSCGDEPKVTAPPMKLSGGLARASEIIEDLSALSNMASVEELEIPFASDRAACPLTACRKNTDPMPALVGESLVLGREDRKGGMPVAVPLKLLPKHMSLFASTGSGKTVTTLNILFQLYSHGVPFVVFAPGPKKEYRRLKTLKNHPDKRLRRLARELRVQTLGSNCVPLRLNPCTVLEGMTQEQVIDMLVAFFSASMAMEGSMPQLLAAAVRLAYYRHRDKATAPTLMEVAEAIVQVLRDKGYVGEPGVNFRALFDAHLGALTRGQVGRVFQCRSNIPSIDRLIRESSILELSNLTQDAACVVVLYVLAAVCQYLQPRPWSGTKPRLVLIIEEAHNILGPSTDDVASETNPVPRAHTSAFISLIMAELRAAGVCVIVMDQAPTNVSRQVVKLTGTKLAFQLGDREDREMLAGAMLLGPAEMAEMVRLRPGQAYFYTEGYFRPIRIRTPNIEEEWNLPGPPSDEELLDLVKTEPWYIEATNARIDQEMAQLSSAMDAFDSDLDAMARQTASLVEEHARQATAAADQDSKASTRLAARVRALHDRLEFGLRTFECDRFNPLYGTDPPEGVLEAALAKWRTSLRNRYVSVLRPNAQRCLDLLDGLQGRCRPPSNVE